MHPRRVRVSKSLMVSACAGSLVHVPRGEEEWLLAFPLTSSFRRPYTSVYLRIHHLPDDLKQIDSFVDELPSFPLLFAQHVVRLMSHFVGV